jgi:hypothetical protein
MTSANEVFPAPLCDTKAIFLICSALTAIYAPLCHVVIGSYPEWYQISLKLFQLPVSIKKIKEKIISGVAGMHRCDRLWHGGFLIG